LRWPGAEHLIPTASHSVDLKHVYPLHAYNHLQATKPQSLVWATGSNPIGQASWFAERFRDWADLRRDFEDIYTKDFIITNIMTYLMTDKCHRKDPHDAASPHFPEACYPFESDIFYASTAVQRFAASKGDKLQLSTFNPGIFVLYIVNHAPHQK
jgi:hypothetical protein